MLDKNNYTPMSDLFDLPPKSLCRVSKNILSDSSYSSINNPQLEKMKSSDHANGLKNSMNRTSELKRIRNFLDQHRDLIPWLKDLIVTSGVKELYEDKYRKLMFEHGTSKHPFVEERL